MKKILAFFTNPIVISIIGLIAISLLIWYLGPQIKFGEDNSAPLGSVTARLIAIMVVFFIWGLNNLWMQARNKKSNSDLVSDLKESKDEGASVVTDQTQEEMAQINERFGQALETLKKYKFKGATGTKALYELPWYIIVGPPGSGKTTALVNSGLEFPLATQFGRASLQGVGGTRNCDWWFTNEAVLIDTAGRYTTQDSHKAIDSSGWEGFLDLLKRNRRRRPINGAIVAISLQDLLTQSEDERMRHAKTIRTRIDELMEKLQIRFPVYLLFTKADLVQGFSEFFEDFSKEEREQVWGVTLPDASSPDAAPDFDYFSNEFRGLTQRLYSRVVWRMHQERDVARRASISGFPQQFENLKGIAENFVKQTFAINRFKFQPYLRGVYFSSGTQDGTPIDRLMASVAANFGFSREVSQAPFQQGKSFFLSRLFREIIFPESELVGSNVSYERTIKWLQRGAYAAMAAITVGLGVVWSGSVMRHKSSMAEVEEYVQEYKQESEKVGKYNKDIRQILPPLNALTKASKVYDQQEHPWLSSLGLYDARVDSRADDAYEAQLKELMQPKLMATLEQEIQKGYEAGDLYDTFRIYMMFKKTDKFDAERVKTWFSEHWETQLRGEGTRRKELEFHLDKLMALERQPAKLNTALVEDTRRLLLREPVAQRVYSRVRTNPIYNRRVDLLSLFGDGVRSSFKLTAKTQRALSVPVLFTKEGFENIDLSAGSPLVTDIVNERWVLTDDENAKVDFIEDDLDEVSKQVEELYLSEYIRVWDDVYASLEITEFRNLRHAKEVLANMVDQLYSPLVAVLQVGQLNTQLKPPAEDIEAVAGKSKLTKGKKAGMASSFLLSQYEGTKVDKHFRELNALVYEGSHGQAPVVGILTKLQELHDFIADIALAPDPSQQAFDLARGRYSNNSGNAITALRAYSQSLPDDVRGWLETLCNQSWKVVLGSAKEYADTEWRALVYRPYNQALKGRYPLNRSSQDDMALYDFSEFFKPGGTLDSFHQQFVAPFISTRGGWRNRVIDDYAMGYSDEFLRQMRNGQQIREIFYRENPETISVTMEMRPRAMDEGDARFTLDVGEQRLVYNHGPKFWKTLKWQANQENMRIRLVFEDLNGAQFDRSYHGPWAWFRLFDSSYVEKTSQSTTYLVTFSAGKERSARDQHKITYEVKTKSIDSPFRRDLLTAFKCPEST